MDQKPCAGESCPFGLSTKTRPQAAVNSEFNDGLAAVVFAESHRMAEHVDPAE